MRVRDIVPGKRVRKWKIAAGKRASRKSWIAAHNSPYAITSQCSCYAHQLNGILLRVQLSNSAFDISIVCIGWN